jgi:site-specific recombinase XerD/RNA polymerase subunit RPABC4/transcription elongation factor Spt4
MDIHNYKRRFERTLERINLSEDISKVNKQTILKFKDYCLSEGIGLAKIERYLFDLMKFSRMLKKPFQEASKEDLRGIIAELEQTNLSPETKKTFKIMLRKIYRFIRGIDKKGVFPEEVDWISINIPSNHKKLPEELLTEDEIKRIIQNCEKLRDKALISSIAESGCRVSEIGTMQIKHISFEEYGARLTVNGKTGMRKILVIQSAPYLQEWVNQHPTNDDSESYLWANCRGPFLSYTGISSILKKASKKAGIKKRVYLHLLRHSRATALASIMTEGSMKQYLGWTQGSKMAGIYIHMSGKDTDNAILEANGIEIQKEKKKSALEPKKCIKCNTINEATNRHCKICGLPLFKEEAEKLIKADAERSQADDIMNTLIKDPEIMALIKKKLNP